MINRLMTTVALACVCTGANAQNLLDNGSFETPGGFLVAPWQNFGNIFLDEGGVEVPAQDGSNSIKMFGASSGAQSDQVLQQILPGTPGTQYNLSGYVWENSADLLGDENVIIMQIQFRDANDFPAPALEVVEVVMFDPTSDPSDQWLFNEVSGIAPPGTTRVIATLLHIQLGADQGFPVQGGGASFWDNIVLTEGDAPCTNPADFDGNGELDFFDIQAFLSAFAEGCPE